MRNEGIELGALAKFSCANDILLESILRPERLAKLFSHGLREAVFLMRWSNHVFLTSAVAPYLFTETVGNIPCTPLQQTLRLSAGIRPQF